ncbi:MAG: hypothetical protein ACLU6O_14875 [Bilophila wadsworthia]
MIRVVALLMALFISIPAYAQNWDEGGTLRDETVIGWAMSTDANKLASAADYIKASTEAGILATLKKGELKRASEDVAACMKQFAESAKKPVTRENSTPYVLACMEKAKEKYPWMQLNTLASVQKAPRPSAVKWDVSRATPIPYVVYSSGWDEKKAINRLKLLLRITPATRDKDGTLILASASSASPEQLAATVIAAAKYYAKDTGATSIGVVLDSLPDGDSAACQLATADYVPDGKGISGKENWTWNGVRAAETPFSDQELEMQQLWGEMRKDFQTSGGETDEAALSKAIGKRMGIPASKVTLPYRMLEDVPQELIDAVKPAPGLTPPKQ